MRLNSIRIIVGLSYYYGAGASSTMLSDDGTGSPSRVIRFDALAYTLPKLRK